MQPHKLTYPQYRDAVYRSTAERYGVSVASLKRDGGIIGLLDRWWEAVQNAAREGIVLSHYVLESVEREVGDGAIRRLRHDWPQCMPTDGIGCRSGVWLTRKERRLQNRRMEQ